MPERVKHMTDSIKKETFSDELVSILPHGEENAIKTKELSQYLGLSRRETRDEVLRARLEGKIICSSRHGYFLPETDDELLTFYLWMRKRCLVGLASLSQTRRLLVERGKLG